MRLASDIGLGRIILGVERVELLIQAGIGRDPGVDRATSCLLCTRRHSLFPGCLSRRPKKRGPFHLVPVIAKSTFERLS